MSTHDRTEARQESRGARRGGMPWMTILAVAGMAAAAFFLLRRADADDDRLTLDRALDLCDRAASQLGERLRDYTSNSLQG